MPSPNEYAVIYRQALLEDIIPFWEKYSPDKQHGGYFSCLDRQGRIYDTDKFIWLQARQAWVFAMLYNQVDAKESWLEMSKSGIDFLMKYGRSQNGRFYFRTSRDGVPLVEPYSIFSDCFAAMAFCQYFKATGDRQVMDLAFTTYQNILSCRENPKGGYDKSTGNRPLKDFALPMILSNLVLEMVLILKKQEIEETVNQCTQEILEDFLDRERGLIHEHVSPAGTFVDCFEGRLINPGHSIEAMWFLIDIGQYMKDSQLIKRATDLIISTLEFGWDKEYGGIFYFLDKQGHPPQQLEWDQKLWWVHLEALVALAKAMEHDRRCILWQWFDKLHSYTWDHFPDPEYGEWYGYLNRQGDPHNFSKGGKWKGCYHVPRGLYQCWQTFESHSNA